MDSLDYYVLQARSQGQADEVTRQQLLAAGWQPDQVEAALSPSAQPSQKSSFKLNNKIKALLVLVVVLLIAVVLASVLKSAPKISYQTVTRNFMLAVQKGEQAKADSYESQTLKDHAQKNVGTTSFEKYCKRYGNSCLSYFSNSFLDNAKLTYSKYTSTSGMKGENLILTLKTTNASTCSSPSDTKILTIGLIPNGNSWLIDSIDPAESGSSC